MADERKAIKGYENLYEITSSGKIYSHKQKRTLKRCEDEYGFHIVKLSNNGKATNHNVFELWKQHFPVLNEGEFKGARTVKYK
jgi:NUMOD4 motif